MNVKELQAALGGLKVDGLPGKNTMAAVEKLLLTKLTARAIENWSETRLRLAAEQMLYARAGIEVGEIDGLMGPSTRYARDVWTARQSGDAAKVKEVETWRDAPQPPPPPGHDRPPASTGSRKPSTDWPRQNESSMNAFFGARGTNQVQWSSPFPFRIAWDLGKTVSAFACHRLVAPHMTKIWSRTLEHYGHDEIKRLRLDLFGGCLNVRKMRGGSAWSIHSWGCAMDVDPERNQLRWKRASASLDDPPYKAFWGFVYDEGAISLGIERDYDWMHFQFARL